MTKAELKALVLKAIDDNRDALIETADTIRKHPELGYKEYKTAEVIKNEFTKLGLTYEDNLAVTGIKTRAKGKASKRTVGVFGEMDAVICPLHPYADASTGAAHACGHNFQVCNMLGVAYGLLKSGAMQYLGGDVVFMGVPAEEMVELEFRSDLIDKGIIKYFSGKQEFLRLGVLDDVDMTMMVHAQANEPHSKAYLKGGSLGNVSKTMRFIGKEAHASRPFEGINALNAATRAMSAIGLQRETFRDEESIRIHPIITKGGDLVNVVPAEVKMETYVRGKTIDGIMSANRKVNRALKGAAYIIGCDVEINEFPGYLPLEQDVDMSELFKENFTAISAAENIIEGVDMVGSTDMGDISQVLPSIHPSMGGFDGNLHSKEFGPTDTDAAYLEPAKAMAMTVIDLLWDDASVAEEICAKSNRMTKEAYFKLWEDLTASVQE